ncbi:MAG: FecR domain-containing protein [Spirochaetales bacterium]|nr:FecR domain-containing protein [Spirochaetales bacterium]
MKKIVCSCVLFVSLFTCVFCQDAYVDYLEGDVYIRDKSGYKTEAIEGDKLETGYSVICEAGGFAEIYVGRTLIQIEENTVFQLLDKQDKEKQTNILSCITGSVLLKVETMTEDQTDLKINTPSANCGVRGTVFRVFSGDDGTSLIAVEEGIVEVESGGKTVELAVEEGVEVKPGETPGEKFKALRGKLDFRDWNDNKLKDFKDDPVTAIGRVKNQLTDLISKLSQSFAVYLESSLMLKKERETLFAYSDDQKEEKNKFYKTTVFPLEIQTSNLFLNVRYYALSALSLRRYVLGRMYIMMKTNSIKSLNSQVYNDFLSVYKQILTLFEKEVVLHLVEADI